MVEYRFTDPFMQETLMVLIAITSMALPSASQVHWIARALWLFSLLSGLISVLYACNQQMTIVRNLHWDDIWRWMNDGPGKATRRTATTMSRKKRTIFKFPTSPRSFLFQVRESSFTIL